MAAQFIVYQAYGKEEILNEALVSIASLYKVTTEVSRPKIVVYTDSVAYLRAYLPSDVLLLETPPSRWKEWKGAQDFVHRAKIEMLRHFTQSYEGSVLYCDTDTYFLSNPSSLFQNIEKGNYVMHIDEGALSKSKNLVFQKLEKFLRKYQYQGKSISSDTHMWNAGVLGFSTSDKNVLDEVLSLSDHLYSAFSKHVMEQLAFSVCFAKKTRSSCEDTIFHYWDFKEYRTFLTRFFEKNRGEVFSKWSESVSNHTPMEFYKVKFDYLRKPYLWRKFLKIIGKGYKISTD